MPDLFVTGAVPSARPMAYLVAPCMNPPRSRPPQVWDRYCPFPMKHRAHSSEAGGCYAKEEPHASHRVLQDLRSPAVCPHMGIDEALMPVRAVAKEVLTRIAAGRVGRGAHARHRTRRRIFAVDEPSSQIRHFWSIRGRPTDSRLAGGRLIHELLVSRRRAMSACPGSRSSRECPQILSELSAQLWQCGRGALTLEVFRDVPIDHAALSR